MQEMDSVYIYFSIPNYQVQAFKSNIGQGQQQKQTV